LNFSNPAPTIDNAPAALVYWRDFTFDETNKKSLPPMNNQSMNRFLGACGATGPLKLIAEGPKQDNVVRAAVDQPFCIIGSGVQTDLRLDDEQVSHRHVYLQVYDGRVFAFDLGSRTGTHWQEERRPHGWLDAGQTIRVGRYRIRLEEDGMADEPPNAQSSEPLVSRNFYNPLLPPVSLEFVKGGARGSDGPTRCPVHRTLVFFGRTDGCKVRLMHSSVSKYHCSLLRTSRGVWVVDLLSRNGVWINGTKVAWARLEEGDRFEVGDFVLRLRYERPEQDQDNLNPPVAVSETPAAREGETGRGGEGEKEGGESKIEDRESNPPSLYPPSSVVDPQSSIVEIDPVNEDAERGRHTMVVSSRRSLVPPELSESIALIISDQFAQMQRQMFDQFQQAMMVMFQTFSVLHRDQMELVRQELNRVHELTRQLHELQAELAKQPGAKDPEVQRLLGKAKRAAAAPAADLSSTLNPEDWNEAFLKAAQKVMAENAVSEAPAPTEPAVFSVASEPASESAVEPSAPQQPAAQSVLNEAPIAPGADGQRVDSPKEATASAPAEAAADIHALLCQKIAALQAERQSRWQKIIHFLAGKQSGQPVP
jgi:pSer/pThr/pTyr-binding forkhead associated (FHA) protein